MLYKFELELSDVDRSVYETLTLRLAQHPSETVPYLLSRLIAYALNYRENIEFPAGGLNNPDAPAVRVTGVHGAIDLWIDIGNPSSTRLHKASKAAKQVKIYTHKRPETLLGLVNPKDVHRAGEIEIIAIEPKFLEELESKIEKNNRWSVLHQQGRLDVNTGEFSYACELKKFRLA